jgi:hypothetical protein
VLRGDGQLDQVDHPRAPSSGRRVPKLEPGEDRPRRPLLVAEIQVISVGSVEVDCLLDEPQAEYADVELDVPWRVGPDHRDVVEPVKSMSSLHGRALSASPR